MSLTDDSDEPAAEPGRLCGEQWQRRDRVLQVHVDGVDVDAAPLAHRRDGLPAEQGEGD